MSYDIKDVNFQDEPEIHQVKAPAGVKDTNGEKWWGTLDSFGDINGIEYEPSEGGYISLADQHMMERDEQFTCVYGLKGCRCENGVKEPDCNEVLCGEPATVEIRGEHYCATHAERIQAMIDRQEKGTPLPPDFFEAFHAERRARGLE
jgi:hypothetical protein